MSRSFILCAVVSSIAAAVATCSGQAPNRPQTQDKVTAVHHSLDLAEKGHCAEALPTLKKNLSGVDDKELKRKAGLAGVRCAMTLGKPETAADFLQILARDFPNDPEVLYVLVHAYLDLSTRAAQELAQVAPDSEQAHLLNAEALEMQGKWDAAAAEYQPEGAEELGSDTPRQIVHGLISPLLWPAALSRVTAAQDKRKALSFKEA